MNEIVRHNYPAANLPEDLRAGLPADARVTVRVEASRDPDLTARERRARVLKQIQDYRASTTTRRSMDEIVSDIRGLRDEWDD